MSRTFVDADYVNVVVNIESNYLNKHEFFAMPFYNYKGNWQYFIAHKMLMESGIQKYFRN